MQCPFSMFFPVSYRQERARKEARMVFFVLQCDYSISTTQSGFTESNTLVLVTVDMIFCDAKRVSSRYQTPSSTSCSKFDFPYERI